MHAILIDPTSLHSPFINHNHISEPVACKNQAFEKNSQLRTVMRSAPIHLQRNNDNLLVNRVKAKPIYSHENRIGTARKLHFPPRPLNENMLLAL